MDRTEPTEDTQHGRYLTFSLGNESYGLAISYVTEIVGTQPITPIPESPDYMKGIINLRGKIIPVLDMRLKFKEEALAYNERTCIVVVDIQSAFMGLIVDQVSEVMTIDDADIVPPPNYKAGARNRYISGVGKVGTDVKLLLDCQMLFTHAELENINTEKESLA